MQENKTNINYYPGHMAKTKRQISETLDLIDVVYEVLDARSPYSSKINNINELIKNKVRILIMTKKDLCNKNETEKWIKYYEKEGYHVLCLDLKDNKDYKKVLDITKKCTSYIQDKRSNKGLKNKEIKALVIGIPNVGKSTLINALVGKKVANVENKPGVTKNLNFLPTNFGITLLDTPGILWPNMSDQNVAFNLASLGSIKKEVLNLGDVIYHLLEIIKNNYKNEIESLYKIPMNEDITSYLDTLGKKWNYIYEDEIDYNRVYEKIYNDFISGRIKNITLDICKTC